MSRFAVAVLVGLVALGLFVALRPAPRRPPGPRCERFDFPVGPPDATGYYDAQPFGGASAHLGSDLNGVRGGNSDLGDPVYSVAAGVVSEADDHGGDWGNVVRVIHVCDEGQGGRVESLYAHLLDMRVKRGQRVARGTRLGSIGTAGGVYPAHLHLELRRAPGLPLGGGYGSETSGHFDPTEFIRRHRRAVETQLPK